MTLNRFERVHKIYGDALKILIRELNPDIWLYDLKAVHALDVVDVLYIQREVTDVEKVDLMLDKLKMKPLSAYDSFMSLLKEKRPDLHYEIKKIEAKYNYKSESDTQNQESSPPLPQIPVAEGRKKSDGMKNTYQDQPNNQRPGESGKKNLDDKEEKSGAGDIPDKRTSQKKLDNSWYYQVRQFVFKVVAAVLLVIVTMIVMHIACLYILYWAPPGTLMYTLMTGFLIVGIVKMFKPSQLRERMSSIPRIPAATNLEDLQKVEPSQLRVRTLSIPCIPAATNLEDLWKVEPDDAGLYTSRHVKPAMPTAEQLRDKENYDTLSPIKGLAYILNNKEFTQRDAKSNICRNGSQVDFINMKHLFEDLGYIIEPYENLNAKDIRETIKSFVAKFNDDDYNSSVVVLMSHGDTGVIMGTDQRPVCLKAIQEEFEGKKCPKLQGKPKLFFIQACRGKKIIKTSITVFDRIEQYTTLPSGRMKHVEDSQAELAPDDNFAKDIPDKADMHFAYATTEGYLSLRNSVEGSWYIQVIMEVFLANAHTDSLNILMNKVSNRVSGLKGKLFDPETKQWVNAKQTPERVSRMRKTFYFLPKYPPTF